MRTEPDTSDGLAVQLRESVPEQSAADGPIVPLTVRSVRLTDLPGLRHVDERFLLNQPEAQLLPYSAIRSALTVSLPWGQPRRRFFVACGGERILGFAQFQPILPDQRWLLVALGSATGVYDAEPVWELLLRHGVIAAGLRGVKRLYARVPAGAPFASAVRSIGFAPYTTETIYVAHDLAAKPRADRVRAQVQSDTWAIHQLYNAAVPRQVQYAEAYTSHRWDAGGRWDSGVDARISGWLMEEGHHVVAYARLTSRGRAHVLEIVAHPERTDLLPAVIDGVLARLPDPPAKRIVCAVRSYQTELASVLERRGFQPALEQDLHIKYTTAAVRWPAFETVPFHVEVRDKLPKRVPTFLRETPPDEAAP